MSDSEIRDVEAEIARTRSELADTMDQITQRAARARTTAVRTSISMAGGLVVGVVGYLVVHRVRAR